MSVTTPPPTASAPVRHPDTPPPGTRLPAHYDHCFGCGGGEPHGLHLAVAVGEGVSISAEFTVTERHQGAPNLAHGGVLAAAFDEAMGYLLWVVQKPAVTGRLETDFVRPVPVGRVLHIEARCTAVDGRKIYAAATGRLDGVDGEVAVRAAGLFVEVGLEHFTGHGADAESAGRSWNP